MSVIPFPGLPAQAVETPSANPATPPPIPADPAAEFEAECLDRWERACMTRGHAAKTLARNQSVLRRFLVATGKRLWEVTVADFQKWCSDLVKHNHVTPSTLRTYQGSLRSCFDYLRSTLDLQNEATTRFQGRFAHIAASDDCLVHTQEQESKRNTTTWSRQELTAFFTHLSERAAWALLAAPRLVRALLRDRVILYVIYGYGLRVEECANLNIDSWHYAAFNPTCGDFGEVTVVGKGANGSGPRSRQIPTLMPELVTVVQWYLRKVRPMYTVRADAIGQPLFVSEHGKRISTESIRSRMAEHLARAGLKDKRWAPHSLRHGGASHVNDTQGLSFTQEWLSHVLASTTQGYLKDTTQASKQRVSTLVDAQIARRRQPPA